MSEDRSRLTENFSEFLWPLSALAVFQTCTIRCSGELSVGVELLKVERSKTTSSYHRQGRALNENVVSLWL